MNKETIHQILTWLESASDEQIKMKQDLLKKLLRASASERKSDIKFILRLFDEEIISRCEVMNFVEKQG